MITFEDVENIICEKNEANLAAQVPIRFSANHLYEVYSVILIIAEWKNSDEVLTRRVNVPFQTSLSRVIEIMNSLAAGEPIVSAGPWRTKK